MKRKLWAVVLAAGLVAGGYFITKGMPWRGEVSAPEYHDPSKSITVRAGREFVVVLASNRTTGYQWQLAGELDKNVLAVSEISYRTSSTVRVGAGGEERWTFKGLQAGSATLPFIYVRPWEKDVPPVQKKDFTVLIKAR